MKKLILMILPVLMTGLVACEGTFVGSGHVVTENRNVSGISAVRLMTSGDLTIEQGSQESLTIEADDNILPELTSDVIGGTLELSMHSPSGFNLHNPIRYHLVVKELHGLTLMGSGDVNAAALVGDQVSITVMGSGDTVIDQITAKTLTINIDGSGDMQINSGQTDETNVHINGSGNYTAGSVKSGKATVTVLGSGDSEVWVMNQLKVAFMGSGNVSFYGKPSLDETHLGSGKLTSLGEK
jgi:hypothetical protein